MSGTPSILHLQDLDLLREELADAAGQSRLRKLGLAMTPHPALDRDREKCVEATDRRWMYLYERSSGRYGRGVVAVRDRVCLGCHITMPTSKSPGRAGAVTLCESCSRLLYWA